MRKFLRIIIMGPVMIVSFPIVCLVAYMYPNRGFKEDLKDVFNSIISGI